MKITRDLIGKNIIRTKPAHDGCCDKSYIKNHVTLVDVGKINLYISYPGFECTDLSLSKWDDGNWEIYHDCHHKCRCWHRKYTYCPDCGKKL